MQSTTTSQPLQRTTRAIIVGASSGIGAALVQELVKHGYTVAALARSQAQLQAVCDEANRLATTGSAPERYEMPRFSCSKL